MNMAARSGVLLIPLGHKRDRLVLRVGDLFGGVLVNNIPVALRQRIAKLQVDLLLAQPGLALAELDRHAAAIQRAANAAHQLILFGALENMVILVVIADRLEVVVVLGLGRCEGLVEQVQLDLRAAHHREAGLLRPRELALQHAPRRDLDHLFLLGEQVAQHHRGARQPGRPPQRREIGHAVEIAIAGLPAGVLVAGDDIHLHIAGQQVVAGVHAIVGHMIHEEVAGDPLAHQAAVHIRENRQHRLDLAALDQVAKLGAGQHAGDWAMVHISPLSKVTSKE